jgi:fructosamine-3-kinase
MDPPSDPLPNPERGWEHPTELRRVERADIESRLGRPVHRWEVLSGGLANTTVRIGDGAVLRIYQRDPETLAKEAALLGRSWRSFRVPKVLRAGADFLVLEHIAHRPIEGSARCGEAVGRALAEIHSTQYGVAGLLGADLDVREPFADFFAALRGHAAQELAMAEPPLPTELSAGTLALLDDLAVSLRAAFGPPVLLHGDFKASNLHWTDRDEVLVLDWEFAYAGAALMDMGQLMRWSPPSPFAHAFAAAYRSCGGHLPEDWRRWAAVVDIVNLVGLLRRAAPGSSRATDVTRRLAATLGQSL